MRMYKPDSNLEATKSPATVAEAADKAFLKLSIGSVERFGS